MHVGQKIKAHEGTHVSGGSDEIDSALADAAKDAGEGHITLLPWNYNSIGAGSWAITIDTAQILNGDWAANANNNNWTHKVFLAKGTYTMRLVGVTSASKGILDVDIDGEEVASFDWYNGSTVKNAIKSQTGIVVAASGLKDLLFRVDGKHGSSTNYDIGLSVITLWRTA